MGEIHRAARRGQRVAIGDATIHRRADLTPTFHRVVEARPASPRAMGPFPGREVQGYRVDVAAVEGRDADALAKAWPEALVQPVALPEASPKAVPIEDLLVWTYRRQRAHTGMMGNDDLQLLYRGCRLSEDGRTTDGCAAIAERGELGVDRIDGGGYRLNRVHPDAETIHERVERLPPAQRRLIIRWALEGEAPPWSAHRPRLGPVLNDKGLPTVKRTKHDQPWYCLIAFDVEPEEVWRMNTDYALWHEALVSLAAELSAPGLLAQHVVGPPKAVVAPWQA